MKKRSWIFRRMTAFLVAILMLCGLFSCGSEKKNDPRPSPESDRITESEAESKEQSAEESIVENESTEESAGEDVPDIVYDPEELPSEGLRFRKENDCYIVSGIGDCTDKRLIIPTEHEGKPVIAVGSGAFSHAAIEQVIVPGGIKIHNNAFEDCYSLTAVLVLGSIDISNYAFKSCFELKSAAIPNITSLSASAFLECRSLEKITVSEENPAFTMKDGVLFDKGMTTLVKYPAAKAGTSYAVPDGITNIGEGAFSQCMLLTSVKLPDSVVSIGSRAFSDCRSLASLTMPDTVTTIGDAAFCYCAFEQFQIPKSLTSIAEFTFWGCVSLTSIDIPDTITSIGDNAFLYCRALTSVRLPKNIEIGEDAFGGTPFGENGNNE